MIKKLVFLMCCLLPVGAGAVVVDPESGGSLISTTDLAWQEAINAGKPIVIKAGNGLSAVGQGEFGEDGYVAPGFSVNNMFVGVSSDSDIGERDLYVLNTVDNPFTVTSAGDISIGAVLQVLEGSTLQFDANDSSALFNFTVGNGVQVKQGAALTLNDIDILTVKGSVVVDGNMSVTADKSILVGDVISVTDGGELSLSASELIDVAGNVRVFGGAVLNASEVAVGSLNVADGGRLQVGGNFLSSVGDINIAGALNFSADNGLYITGTDPYTIQTTGTDADIRVGAVSVANKMNLTLMSADDFVVAGDINNSGVMNVTAGGALQISGSLYNNGSAEYQTISGDMFFADIYNLGALKLVSSGNITVSDGIENTVYLDVFGRLYIQAVTLNANSLNAKSTVNIVANTAKFNNDVTVDGHLYQGGDTEGSLNLNVNEFTANTLAVTGEFVAVAGSTQYNLGTLSVDGDINVQDGAYVDIVAKGVDVGGILNIDFGTLKINSGNGLLNFADLTIGFGNLVLDGVGMTMSGELDGVSLYQGDDEGMLSGQDINIVSNNYQITTSGIDVQEINQSSGKLLVKTSDVNVEDNIYATDLRFVAQLGDGWTDDNPDLQWLNVNVGGDVSGGVQFVGLKQMDIEGNYEFDLKSALNAAVLQYSSTGAFGTTDRNYWATVDSSYIITNAENGEALISVGGVFSSDTQYDFGSHIGDSGDKLGDGQIAIDLFDVVDQGTAIWLLHANGGIEDFASLNQLNVRFCNADGSLCYNYLDSVYSKDSSDLNKTDEIQPAYLTVRDTDGNGVEDSLYVVFGSDFMGPILLDNLKIQSIVSSEAGHTQGEYESAGALDDLLIGQAHNKKFFKEVPLGIVPEIFAGTNMQEMASELADRMLYYFKIVDGTPLMNFSRLFQVREIELLSGAVALNEHTAFRSFEDRMFDEFIWNRNRQLKKAWLDVDYGMFYQNINDAKHTDGNRFSISGGFDWQESNTMILGLTGRISQSVASADDAMDLGYIPGKSIAGHLALDVKDTNVALGGYFMKTFGEELRLYGNAFLDLHMFDVERNQNYVDTINGEGTAFSVIGELGLMHDILNQYVVGNAYVRTGYNFGWDVQEQVRGDDYMRLNADGYFILTPGYSLMAQKRIYPSVWMQVRPYASVGVEYDVFGAPDVAKYKFAPAEKYTEYAVDVNPLWLNVGGGVEVLSAIGIQMGLDYRYQYNNDIQLHNIRVSGSYRF